MKLGKKVNNKMVYHLHNYFLPVHEHLGFENSKSIHEITEHILNKVNIGNGHSKKCEYFKELFISYLYSKMNQSILNPESKFFHRGLMCETLKHDGSPRIGFYYFVKDESERRRIENIKTSEIKGMIIKNERRNILEAKKHLKAITHKK